MNREANNYNIRLNSASKSFDENTNDELANISEFRPIQGEYSEDYGEYDECGVDGDFEMDDLPEIFNLIPFIASIGLYFTLFFPEHIPSFRSTIVKCLPILSLALFTILHKIYANETKMNRIVLAGLLFSCVGDACLVWPDYFVHGVVAFAVGQMFFIKAGGLEPINLKLGFIFIPYATTVLYLIKPGVLSQPLVLAAAVSLYSPILLGRVWLACSKLLRNSNCATV